MCSDPPDDFNMVNLAVNSIKASGGTRAAAAAIWLIVALCTAASADVDALIVDRVQVEVAAPQPEPTPAADPPPAAKARAAKAAKTAAERSLVIRLRRMVLVPAVRPYPLAFGTHWMVFDPMILAEMNARRVQVAQQAVRARAGVLRLGGGVPANQNLEPQLRAHLEPMLKIELSFAARAMGLKDDDRRQLIVGSKKEFDKFVTDFAKNSDPNQRQMLLQGMNGMWFGGNQPNYQDPRRSIQEVVSKVVESTLPKEKKETYTAECRKREEFYRETSIDNLVARIDEKVNLSPEQRTKITDSLAKKWDDKQAPQLEAFAMNTNMWPGAPDDAVQPHLTAAQQIVLKRLNTMSGRVFFGGMIFGVPNQAVDDIDLNVDAAVPGEEAKSK
jgi:hypothetical protein